MGGDVARLSWRKCQKVAPSCRGFFGAPRDVVLPIVDQPREGFVELLGPQSRAQFDHAPRCPPIRCCLRNEGPQGGTMIVSPARATSFWLIDTI